MASFEHNLPDANRYDHYAEDLFSNPERKQYPRQAEDDEAEEKATASFPLYVKSNADDFAEDFQKHHPEIDDIDK